MEHAKQENRTVNGQIMCFIAEGLAVPLKNIGWRPPKPLRQPKKRIECPTSDMEPLCPPEPFAAFKRPALISFAPEPDDPF
jgi:hypothetical protein